MTNKTAVYIMGAGRGSRLGLDIPKPLVKIGGSTILAHNYDDWSQDKDIPVVVVTGYECGRYWDKNLALIHNPHWEYGIKSSYERVLRDADKHDIDRIIVVDGDLIVSSQTIREMLEFSKKGYSETIAVVIDPEKANPCIGVNNLPLGGGMLWGCIASFKKERFRKTVACMEDNLLYTSLIDRNIQIIVEDRFFIGINTPDDLEQSRELLGPKKKKTKTNNNAFWERRKIDMSDPVKASRLHGGVLGDRRLVHEMLAFKEVMSDVYMESVIDLGCGTGELYPLILEMTDYITAIDVNKEFRNIIFERYGSSRIIAYCHDITNLSDIPITCLYDYDCAILGGIIQYFDDKTVLRILNEIPSLFLSGERGYVLIRNTTAPKQTETIDKHVDHLEDDYFCIYRTFSDLMKLVEQSKHDYRIKKVSRVYPDELESKHGTLQYYILFEVNRKD